MTQGFAPAPRPGEGVSDPAELVRLIDLLRRTEQTGQKRQDIRVGEFLVDAARVPLSLVAGLQTLTRTEAASVRLLGWGRSNADIGLLLGINETTARSHLNSAVVRLGLDGMRQLGAVAGLLFHPLD
jgi:DNA-binding CsgD family transcriptional regulator